MSAVHAVVVVYSKPRSEELITYSSYKVRKVMRGEMTARKLTATKNRESD